MNLGRDSILGRVRAALRTEAHQPAPPTPAPIWPAMGEMESRRLATRIPSFPAISVTVAGRGEA